MLLSIKRIHGYSILILFLSLIISFDSWSQSKLFMNPIKYTDRQLEVYGSSCSNPSQIKILVNGVRVNPNELTQKFFVTGYYAFEMNFGVVKPGDVFKVQDECGSEAYQRIVEDDYAYVEVPNRSEYTGNGVGSNDQDLPYGRLSKRVEINKCVSVDINSHGLVSYYVFSPQTTGVFKINGAVLTDAPTTLNPGGYDINFNGFQGDPTYTVNPNGSISSNTVVKLESKTHYSGNIPIQVEYIHGGEEPSTDISFGFKPLSIRHVKNSTYEIEKAALGGNFKIKKLTSHPNSVFKVTYDGVYYRAYRDGELVDELRRFVEYSTSSGTLSPSSTMGLDYATEVQWSGMNIGHQWVGMLLDGVLYTRQLFNVSETKVTLTRTN